MDNLCPAVASGFSSRFQIFSAFSACNVARSWMEHLSLILLFIHADNKNVPLLLRIQSCSAPLYLPNASFSSPVHSENIEKLMRFNQHMTCRLPRQAPIDKNPRIKSRRQIQCTGISLHTKLKCLHSLAHLYKMLVLSTWTLHILYNNVYRHFLLIYWAQFKMLQTLPRHDWKSTKNGHFAHPWESVFSDPLRLCYERSENK